MFDPVKFIVISFVGIFIFHPAARYATADVLHSVANTISAPETSTND